jgi:hypothetical protein
LVESYRDGSIDRDFCKGTSISNVVQAFAHAINPRLLRIKFAWWLLAFLTLESANARERIFSYRSLSITLSIAPNGESAVDLSDFFFVSDGALDASRVNCDLKLFENSFSNRGTI